MPACWAGMPAIAVAGTATNTRPTPRPSDEHARQQVGREPGVLAGQREQGGAGRDEASRRRRCSAGGDLAQRVLARWVPAVMASGEREEREAGAQRGVAQHGLEEDAVRNTGPPAGRSRRASRSCRTPGCGPSTCAAGPAAGRRDARRRRTPMQQCGGDRERDQGAGRQPAVGAVLARPYIRAPRPPMTVSAPGRSNWARPARAVTSLGRTLGGRRRARGRRRGR